MILDTCALIWLSEGGGQLSKPALERILNAREVYVSAISGFEIGVKYRKGKLELPMPVADWVEAVIQYHNLSVIDVSMPINMSATQLPLLHLDPFDRIIIATARSLAVPIVSGDEVFSDYDIEVIH